MISRRYRILDGCIDGIEIALAIELRGAAEHANQLRSGAACAAKSR